MPRALQELSKEKRCTVRLREQRDDAEKKMNAMQEELDAVRGQKEKSDKDVARVQAILEETTGKLSEMEKALAEVKRVKNRDCRPEHISQLLFPPTLVYDRVSATTLIYRQQRSASSRTCK